MSTDRIAEQIERFVSHNFLFDEADERFTREDSFVDTGIIDSTGMLELIGFVESRFGIRVDESEMIPENLDSVRQLSVYVTRKTDGS